MNDQPTLRRTRQALQFLVRAVGTTAAAAALLSDVLGAGARAMASSLATNEVAKEETAPRHVATREVTVATADARRADARERKARSRARARSLADAGRQLELLELLDVTASHESRVTVDFLGSNGVTGHVTSPLSLSLSPSLSKREGEREESSHPRARGAGFAMPTAPDDALAAIHAAELERRAQRGSSLPAIEDMWHLFATWPRAEGAITSRAELEAAWRGWCAREDNRRAAKARKPGIAKPKTRPSPAPTNVTRATKPVDDREQQREFAETRPARVAAAAAAMQQLELLERAS